MRFIDRVACSKTLNQSLKRYRFQLFWRRVFKTQSFEEPGRACRAIEGAASRHLLAAHRGSSVEQAFSGGARHHGCDLRAAAGLAEHHDALRIAAKTFSVCLHPVKRKDQIPLARIAAVRELPGEEAVEIEVTKGVEPVIDRDDHHIAFGREIGAVIELRRARPVRIRAAMNIEHDRTFAAVIEAGRPDIQEKAVFGDFGLIRSLRARRAISRRVFNVGT